MDYNITIPEYCRDLSKHMYQLQQTGVLCDAWLVCKDGVVFVHKLVLMACGSAYLQQQLSTDNSTTTQCQVFLKDYSLKTVYDFVQALYIGSFTLNHDRAVDILKLFTFLDVTVFTSTVQGVVDNDPNLKQEVEKGRKSNSKNCVFYEVEIAKDSFSAPVKVPVKAQKSNIIMERIVDNSFKSQDQISQSSVETPKRNRILIIKSDTAENTKRKNNTNDDGCIPKKQARVSKQTLNVIQTSPNICPLQTKLEKEPSKNIPKSQCCTMQSDHTYEADNTKELLNIAKSLSTSDDPVCIGLSDIDEDLLTNSDGTISEFDKSKTLSTNTDMGKSGKDGEQQEQCQLCQKISEDSGEKKDGQYICRGCVSLFTGEDTQTDREKKKQEPKGKKEKKDLFDTPKTKRKNKQYHYQALLDAYYAVKDGGMPVRTACRLYAVPRETLRDRINGKRSINCVTTGRGTIFTKEEETKLADEVKRMAKCGYYYTCKEITDIATDYCVLMEKRTSDQHLTLKWYRGFFTRWPDLQMLYTKRPRKSDVLSDAAESKKRFFTEFGDLLDKHDFTFKPHFVFNLHVSVIKTKESQSVGVIGCGSASGIAIPPYFIFQEQETRDNAVNSMNNIPTVVSENGYTSFVFVDYMKNHFIKFLPERTNESVLLILDGFKSHLCVELIGFTKDNNILTQFIPANCDRSLSPIEHCCSAQLQDCYDEICLRKIHLNEPIYFCDVACEAYNEAFSQEILGEAFVKSGLCSIENNSAV
ncbi:uncharacterized protein LOC127712219 isoform X2 [Mytilus californianus]|uniref:uncharacterized protein LOC127712219 isoform X2 n=1 Tax=Mytilus californianus TaxID=6549 RepID=UPI002247F3EE|nr:uncharacterized protein LOC127712219 isoform X2 [Mytilus californianus]